MKPIQEIPYTASTGRKFVLQQLEDETAGDGWPRLFWTYTYEHVRNNIQSRTRLVNRPTP